MNSLSTRAEEHGIDGGRDDDASSVSTTVCSDMNADLVDVSLEACSFGSAKEGEKTEAAQAAGGDGAQQH